MTNNVHFSKNSDEWATPQHFFDKYNSVYSFGIDVAASVHNSKCKRFYSIEDDGLSKSWCGVGNVWCNPPYSQLKQWIKKAYDESQKGATVVMLIPARTDTIAWHEYIFPFALKIEFIKGRLKFGDSKNSAPFPSAVVIFGDKDSNK